MRELLAEIQKQHSDINNLAKENVLVGVNKHIFLIEKCGQFDTDPNSLIYSLESSIQASKLLAVMPAMI